MKKLLLPILILVLSGCGLFNQEQATTEEENLQVEETSMAVETVETTLEQEETSSTTEEDYDNVFGENVMGDNPYPATALEDDYSIGELREAMEEYFTEMVPPEEKDNNLQPIDEDTLEQIQLTLDTNEVYQPLQATVDQITIPIQDQDQYVLRIVVPMSPQEAEDIEANNDILLLNEALAQVGNRLVLIAYLDESGEYLIPYHLNTSTYSLFSQGE